MGFFGKSDEEKQKEAQEKQNARQQHIKKVLDVLGADLDSYSEEDIKEKNFKDFEVLAESLGPETFGKVLSSVNMSNYERLMLTDLNTLMRQNMVTIRQNELIIRLLKEIAKQK